MLAQFPPMLLFVGLLVLAAPVAWLTSEFQERRWLRVCLGTAAILMSFGVAFIVGTLQNFQANIWYGTASEELIRTTVLELEAGNTESVIVELKSLDAKFQPTYENRARYDEVVEEYVENLRRGRRFESRVID